MANFTKALKLEEMEFGGFTLEFHNKQPKEFKANMQRTFKPSKGRCRRNADKIINQLTSMYQALPEEVSKQHILDMGAFACSRYLHRSCFTPVTYTSLLVLTFPLVREIVKLLPTFEKNFFTPEILMQKLDFPFESEETKKDLVYNALRTLLEVCAIKKLKKGLFKRVIYPLPDVQALESVLLAAQEIGAGDIKQADMLLRNYSFEINHKFVKFFAHINYAAIVPENTLKEFLESDENFSLQYNDGNWIVSNNEFLYQESNLPITAFRRDFYISVDQMIAAKKSAENENFQL